MGYPHLDPPLVHAVLVSIFPIHIAFVCYAFLAWMVEGDHLLAPNVPFAFLLPDGMPTWTPRMNWNCFLRKPWMDFR